MLFNSVGLPLCRCHLSSHTTADRIEMSPRSIPTMMTSSLPRHCAAASCLWTYSSCGSTSIPRPRPSEAEERAPACQTWPVTRSTTALPPSARFDRERGEKESGVFLGIDMALLQGQSGTHSPFSIFQSQGRNRNLFPQGSWKKNPLHIPPYLPHIPPSLPYTPFRGAHACQVSGHLMFTSTCGIITALQSSFPKYTLMPFSIIFDNMDQK